MTSYGQYCPVAKAMELLDERWTLLVVRELLHGSTHFNDVRRGVPHMSPALLSKRLQRLERANLVEKRVEGPHTSYRLTEAGLELGPIVTQLSEWGIRWVHSLGREDLDPHVLLWDMRRIIDVDAWPRRRTLLALRFTDTPTRAGRWWLLCTEGDLQICDYDPGFDLTATITCSLHDLTLIWRGDRAWREALQSGDVVIEGRADAVARVPEWIGQAEYAGVARPVGGARIGASRIGAPRIDTERADTHDLAAAP
jgi:DNA-binding HxlR family transcriptional regulator